DMGYLGDMPIIVLASKGALQQTKFLAVTDADEGGASEIYVAKDSPIKTIKDLNGKRVSIPFGGYSHRFAEVLAAIEGINFEFVGQSPEVGLTNLQAGKVFRQLRGFLPGFYFSPMSRAVLFSYASSVPFSQSCLTPSTA